MDYWYVKAELCSGRMADIMDLVEVFIHAIFVAIKQFTNDATAMLGTRCSLISISIKRITYIEALEFLNARDLSLSFGQKISKNAEDMLTKHFGRPVWVTHKPRELELFLYSICPEDNRLTMTADLISPNGFGWICGVVEKSLRREELESRMKEKGKDDMLEIYGWVLESRDFGMVYRTACGMGFERVPRWYCGPPPVNDAIPFPRIFGCNLMP